MSDMIERVALDAIEFIEDLTADPLLDAEDVEMSLEDVQAHAGIEAASLRKRLAAALEAEASEGGRMRAALTTALALIEDYLAYRHDGDLWSEDARLMGEMEINYAAKDGRLDAIRAALIPEAPVREGE